MDADRAKATKLAVEHIDRHLNVYSNPEDQKVVLEELIQKHDLKGSKMVKQGLWNAKTRVPLEAKKYREILTDYAKKYGRSMNSSGKEIDQLFRKGSKVLTEDCLEMIEFVDQTGAPDSDGEEEVNDRDASSGSEDGSGRKQLSSNGIQNAVIQDNPKVQSAVVENHNGDQAGLNEVPQGDQKADESEQQVSDCTSEEVVVPKKRENPAAETPSIAREQATVDATAGALVGMKRAAPSGEVRSTGIQKQNVSVDLTEGIQPRAKKSKQSPPVLPATSNTLGLLKLSIDAIRKDMNAIWLEIQSYADTMMIDGGGDAEKRPIWVGSPDNELHEIYCLLFGPDWKRGAHFLSKIQIIKAVNVVQVCLAAAIYRSVFRSATVPWTSAQDIMATLSEAAPYMNRVLRETAPGLQLHTLVWHAAKNQVLDSDFQETRISQEAVRLADDFSLTMDPQLDRLGVRSKDSKFWAQSRTSLANIFFMAFVLKGQIHAAPDYYSIEWVSSGTDLDKSKMQEVHNGTGRQVVACSVMPLVSVSSTKGGQARVACPAKVLSVPKVDFEAR